MSKQNTEHKEDLVLIENEEVEVNHDGPAQQAAREAAEAAARALEEQRRASEELERANQAAAIAAVIAAKQDALYENLQRLTESGGLTVENVAFVLIGLMQFVDSMDDISGPEKKALVISTLTRYIEDDGNPCNLPLDLLPSVIDALVAVDKNELKIHVRPHKCIPACAQMCGHWLQRLIGKQ